MDWGWRVHIERDWTGMGDKLTVHRRLSDGVEVLTGWEDGRPVMQQFDSNTYPGDEVSIRLPEGVLEAIAEWVKPGPSSSDLKVLNEALALERNRVDNMLYVLKEGFGGSRADRTD